MMCGRKKGFTLIELLAVIIIIGVIALIITPIIIDVLHKQEKKTFEESVHGIMESIRIDTADDNFSLPREYYYKNGTLTLEKAGNVEREDLPATVKVNGRYEGEGRFIVDEDGDILVVNACNGTYCINNSKNNNELVVEKDDGTHNPVRDPEDPVIELIDGNVMMIGIGSTFVDPGVKSETRAGDALAYTTEIRRGGKVVDSIDTTTTGTYEITYTNSNNGKTAVAKRTVKVVEMKPQITITKADSNYVRSKTVVIRVTAVSPNKVTGFTYQIEGENPVQVTGNEKTITLNSTGIVSIVVRATDNNGHSDSVTGGPYRIDATGPEITIDPETVSLDSSAAASYNIFDGVSVIDNIDGVIDNSKITTSGDTLLSIPGTYRVNYTVSDRLGNTSTATRTFVVSDSTKPQITIAPEETTKFVQSQSVKITATDNNRVDSIAYVIIKDGVRGTSNPINNGGSVTLNSTGNYQIEVTATDDSGNVEVKTSKTYMIDTTKPELVFNNETLSVDGVAGYNLMTGVTATDNSGVTPTITYTGGLSATVGTQTITYKATDEAGNVATRTRTFTITAATAPIISYSPIQTNGWVKSVNITISATVKVGENLSAFTYSINNGAAQNGNRNGNTGTASVTLNTTGTYTISATATGGYGNSKTEGSGTYYIDATVPTVGAIGGNTDSWTTSKTLTATLSDSHSGISAYAWTTSSATPTSWTSVTNTSSYSFSKNVTANGTYYLWAKDAAGNISAAKSVTVSKIDVTTPSITSSYTSTAYSVNEKTSVAVSTLYSATFGGMGGSVTCKNGTTTITNLNSLAVGTYTLTCTATGGNGKTASVKPKVTIKSAGTSGSDLANKDSLSNLANLKRYRGANPNNWVCFGKSSITNPGSCDANHKWRIIGIDGSGRMKIMTNYYYSTGKRWDTSGGTYGSNNWGRPADLKTELNGSSFYSNNTYIDATHRGYIINATWYTGGQQTNNYQLQDFVNGERSNSTTGYVGLMSMTDFGYAGSGCTLTTVMTSTNNACMSNNWIGYSKYQWSITPDSGYTNFVWYVPTRGGVDAYNTFDTYNGVRPVVYLDSSVKITGGTGTESNPYILSK